MVKKNGNTNGKKEKEIKTRNASISLDDEGMIRVIYMPGLEETLEDAETVMGAIARISGEMKRPCLIFPAAHQTLSRDVRIYYIKTAPDVVTALAAISTSPVIKVTLNFMMGLAKSIKNDQLPARIFTSEEEAVNWLKQFRI